MPVTLTSLADLAELPFDTVIDVRSPSEYAEDHIPGAISLPVLSDMERARVGTIYTEDSPFRARKVGAALVARNAAAHLEGPLAEKGGGWRPLIYCWRGGQRSGSFASILSQVGWRADTIAGGYQGFRRLVVRALHDEDLPHRLVLLDGNTGTAKTDLLLRVSARGGQVVDLEALANHRGSLFGGQGGQPAQKGFESALALALMRCDPARPVLVEAESSRIGDLLIPPSVWAAMKDAPRLVVTAAPEVRARYLARAYADLTGDQDGLLETIAALAPYQGHAQVAAWQRLARAGAFEELAGELMSRHYDPRYAKARSRHDPLALGAITLGEMGEADLDRAADAIAAELGRIAPRPKDPANA